MKSVINDFYSYLFSYMNNNLYPTNDKGESLKQLSELFNHAYDYICNNNIEINLDINSYTKLIKSNKNLKCLINNIIDNKKEITRADINKIRASEKVIQLIEIYCIINNILVSENYTEDINNTIDENNIENTDSDFSSSRNVYLQQIVKIPPLTEKEIKELPIKIANGDREARDRFIAGNLHLVVYVIRNFFQMNEYFEDFIQEGYFALDKAIKNYRYDYGNRFSTYAVNWIKLYISNFIIRKTRNIKLPCEVSWKKEKLERTRDALIYQYGREVTSSEIASASGMSIDEVEKAFNIIDTDTISIYESKNDDSDMLLLDTIKSESISTDEEAIEGVLKRDLRNLLQLLPEKQRKVIELIYNNEKPYKLTECGATSNSTRQNANNLEKAALINLRKMTDITKFLDYMEDPDVALENLRQLREKDCADTKEKNDKQKKYYRMRKQQFN